MAIILFAHPIMLAWLAAAAVPLVLHFAGRAAYRTADWSAMLFLPGGSAAGAAGRGRARDWLLLLCRAAAVALLVIAAARPRLPAGWAGVPTAGLAASGRVTVALVVVDAAGTAYARDGASRFDEASRVALGVLAGLGRGDRACVLPDPPPIGWSDARPSADLSAAAAAVAGLRPTRRPGDLADALDRAATALADAAGAREIVVVCDREAVPWRNVTDAFGRAWRGRRDPAGRPPPRVVVVPVGGDESDNVAVESVRPVDPPLVRDLGGVVRVTVRNYGPAPRAAVPLAVWSGPRQLADTTVTLAAHGSATVDVPVRLDGEGPRVVSAAVRTGGLSFDDRRDGVVDVAPPARVLIVAGDPDRAYPLRAAVAPNATAGRPGADPAVATVVDPAAWAAGELGWYDVVVLADVGEVAPDRADDLRRFVDDGGGLLLAPGGRVSATDYNDALGDAGVGLLPAVLGDPRPVDPPLGLRPPDARHPVTRFTGSVGGDAARAAVRVMRSFTVVGRPAGPTVLATTDGQPIAIANDLADAGRVVLLTVPLEGDDEWDTMPRTGFYLPLVQSAVRWLSADRGGARGHEVVLGRPIVWTVDGAVDGNAATVTLLPGNRRDPARVVRRGDRTELRVERPTLPGTYRLRYRVAGKDQATYVVVAPPPEASDLTPMSTDDWRAVGRRVGAERAEPAALAAAVARGRGGPEGWVEALGGTLLLLVGETLLGRHWSGVPVPSTGR